MPALVLLFELLSSSMLPGCDLSMLKIPMVVTRRRLFRYLWSTFADRFHLVLFVELSECGFLHIHASV